MKFAAAILILVLSGCGLMPKRQTPIVSPITSVAATGAVELRGDVKVPAKVDTKRTETVLPLPEGSRFEFNEKLGVMTLTLAKATSLSMQRQETTVAGPTAFTPDALPTVRDVADAKAALWTQVGLKIGLFIGTALAIFGLVRGWDILMWGGAAIAGACAFGIFIEKHPLLLAVIGIGTAAAVLGPLIWHWKLKSKPASPLA